MNDRSVLIVDDNPMNLKLLRSILEDEGLTLSFTSSAEETLTLLESLSPRLILMDVQLPMVDGLTLTRQLRTERRFDATWIVGISAYATPADRARALDAGCDGYITKPIDASSLPQVVESYLERARA